MNELISIGIFFFGITLGLWIGWRLWRYPKLKYGVEE